MSRNLADGAKKGKGRYENQGINKGGAGNGVGGVEGGRQEIRQNKTGNDENTMAWQGFCLFKQIMKY